MTQANMLSINSVAAKMGLSVHQLRRWELMFGLEIKRGRGQQRQYRQEDITVLERIRELVDQGWPTGQIRPQLEAEGLITPKLIGLPVTSSNPEVMMESVIGLRNFCERRFFEISKQIDELRQLVVSLSVRAELKAEDDSPESELMFEEPQMESIPREISIGPATSINHIDVHTDEHIGVWGVTDQNYLTVLGKALDIVGWSDSQADEYSMKNYGTPVWIDLGRSHAEMFIQYLRSLMTQDVTA